MLISGLLYFVFAHLFQPSLQTTGTTGSAFRIRGKEFRVADASFSLLTGNSIETRLVRAGGIIFREGEQANELFVIKSGYVRIQVGNKTMADLAPDTIFGEMALIDNEPRSATATALTDVELVPVSEKQFLFLVSQTPHFALKVMRTLAQRLRTMNRGVY
ncbi:Crp/Fnr family transcriptional regulator [Bradyrhizobium brasilense]|uniref:Cyclic nucleotide-binding domain-containing protein n=1 Tax=Bradyrhizobium brasilense TaxID=1419277 RepID=A0A1G7BFC4_9BRAD|nr:cyclic nucleotide-binding domain-containing protein [Bradyrhizobium brasilense]MCC8975813.1 cyclic nucleotide-binding domain-containing protein [Bradyrhizobium brasilense]SDE25702.1 Cyclic nucleotide-binding domain-containing protein [Bradyrhizobium brasilense]